MATIHIEGIPQRRTSGDVLRWLVGLSNVRKNQIGRIDVDRSRVRATVEDAALDRVMRSLREATWDSRPVEAWCERPIPGSEPSRHLTQLGRLMKLEADAELSQVKEARSNSAGVGDDTSVHIGRLELRDREIGVGGHLLVALGKPGNAPIPRSRFSVGTPVLMSPQGDQSSGWRGVVSTLKRDTIQLALPEDSRVDDATARFQLDMTQDDVSRERERNALLRAQHASSGRLAELRDVLLGSRPPAFSNRTVDTFLDPTLNETQQDAVRLCLQAEDLAVIHGPPGTGKTTAVVEVIRQAIGQGQRILACAPSNLAVDNIVEKLVRHGVDLIRLGHPVRVLPTLWEQTLDAKVENHPEYAVARALGRDAAALLRKAGKTGRNTLPRDQLDMRREAYGMFDDMRRIEDGILQQLLKTTPVVCSTLTGLAPNLLSGQTFDATVVDEACQCPEPSCWIPVSRCNRLILSGDPCQLPPTVLSPEAARRGFAVSLPERLLKVHGQAVVRRLTDQYRMHEHIMTFSSREFYEDTLAAHPSVANHRLTDLPEVTGTELTESSVWFIDTSGAGFEEETESDGGSRRNVEEAQVVVTKARELLRLGMPPASVGVISPYSAQVQVLADSLRDTGIEVATVDGFQGRENEVIIISLVRSNSEGEVGFLADTRRMNVALTRARRLLIVAGDSATLCRHPFYDRMLAYFDEIGAYRTVWEEM
ncbi:MAG: AAA family ATPase [Lentisphaerae bacterium]|nr:AAA family ATPase [Lentisphaerota bacterium]MBT4816830.1 AAA family ATPase [Lentisphaerota bacterium]MBT5612092.1 AAA family ATPase [Lentisphaerota bacterium]MBT7060554.1 AAA family ATPase [Lentisphaerota bacterium]MBT7840681.1 AAA family ATPase [Lentisphaerota bacterium]